MFRLLDCRAGHGLLLALVWAAVTLPNLGGPSLWDIDEGNNVEAACEMYASGNWVIPTFNYQLRVDKPALLYWLQIASFQVLGVNEFAGRWPSALAALLAILATCELGRRLFNPATGLLGGLVLATSPLFCASARFANPDALLNLFSLLTLASFACDYPHGGRRWFLWAGVFTGLAMLAKGPVGLVLPGTVLAAFLLWEGQLRRLLDPRLLAGLGLFLLVAAPWYAWVGAETKGQWLRGFFLTHNLDRFRAPMENHGGPFVYYLGVLLVGLAPWSVFLGPTAWYAARPPVADEVSAWKGRSATRFLLCWCAVYLVFFTVARTKLPNYILPIYPAVALLTARFLDLWRRGLLNPPGWVPALCLACLVLLGMVVALALAVAGGALELPFVKGRRLPGLEAWSWVGALYAAAAMSGWWCLRRGQPGGVVAAIAAAAVLFTALVAGWGPNAVDRHKAPRELARHLPADHHYREVRLAAFGYFQPSLVFYCQREVQRLESPTRALEFLRTPLPCYLFVPARLWDQLHAHAAFPVRSLGRHHDFYTGQEIVLITNE